MNGNAGFCWHGSCWIGARALDGFGESLGNAIGVVSVNISALSAGAQLESHCCVVLLIRAHTYCAGKRAANCSGSSCRRKMSDFDEFERQLTENKKGKSRKNAPYFKNQLVIKMKTNKCLLTGVRRSCRGVSRCFCLLLLHQAKLTVTPHMANSWCFSDLLNCFFFFFFLFNSTLIECNSLYLHTWTWTLHRFTVW